MKQIRDKEGKFANALTEKNIKLGKRVLVILAFLILTSIFYNLTKKTVEWFKHNTILFKSPITISFTKPVEVISLQELSVRESKTALINQISDDVIKQYLNPDSLPKCTDSVTQINPTVFFNEIRQKESSNGTNDNPVALHNYCAKKGKSNEIGYSPSDKFCFNDLDESKLFIAYWVKKNCEYATMNSCLCFYNTGKFQENCNYVNGNLGFAN